MMTRLLCRNKRLLLLNSKKTRTNNFFKWLRTLMFTIYNGFCARSTVCTRGVISIPTVVSLTLVLIPILVILDRSQPRFRFISYISNCLHHDQLNVSSNHFQPPSRFAPDFCLREYDQAWSVLRARASPPSPKPYAQIAFAIQASGDTVQLLPRLLSHIHHQRNVYVIHIDAKTDTSARKIIASLIQSNPHYGRNVHLYPSEMLTYKGISTVLNSIALMTHALELHPDWDYYINISGSDYPLLSPDNIGQLLARPQVPPGLLNFVWFFPRKEWIPYSFRVRNMFWDPAAAGAQSMHTRLHAMASQRTHPLEQYRAYIFTKAEAWSILSRPFIQFIVRSAFAKRMFLNHMHVLSVSEHFITDTLFNHPVWRTTVVPDAFRKVVWYFHGRRSGQHPYKLDQGPSTFAFWEFLDQSKCIFARKFSIPNSKLMDRIDAEISGHGLNGSDSRLTLSRRRHHVFYKRLVSHFDKITKQTLRQQGYKWPTTAYPNV